MLFTTMAHFVSDAVELPPRAGSPLLEADTYKVSLTMTEVQDFRMARSQVGNALAAVGVNEEEVVSLLQQGALQQCARHGE